MSNRILLLVLALIPILLIIGIAGVNSLNNTSGIITQPQSITTKSFTTKSDDQNEVIIDVTPKVLEVGQEAIIEVTFNTHSVALDFDLTKISKLIDDQGNIYQPVSWTGGSGGHHLSGVLTFSKLLNSKSIELIISGVAGVDRTFSWDL